MRTVFADTFYWVAISNQNDDWHSEVIRVSKTLGNVFLITTDEVMDEFLTHFCKMGPFWRAKAVELVHKIRQNPNVRVVPQTRDSFNRGFLLYESRPDKDYSLTDCISMEYMRENGVHDVLTHDHHFQQEGFTLLFQEKVT